MRSILSLLLPLLLSPQSVDAVRGERDKNKQSRKLHQFPHVHTNGRGFTVINVVDDGEEPLGECIEPPEDYEAFQLWYDYNLAYGFYPGSPLGPSKAAFDLKYLDVDPYYDYWIKDGDEYVYEGSGGDDDNFGGGDGGGDDIEHTHEPTYDIGDDYDDGNYYYYYYYGDVYDGEDAEYYSYRNRALKGGVKGKKYKKAAKKGGKKGYGPGYSNDSPAYVGVYDPNNYGEDSFMVNGLLELEWCLTGGTAGSESVSAPGAVGVAFFTETLYDISAISDDDIEALEVQLERFYTDTFSPLLPGLSEVDVITKAYEVDENAAIPLEVYFDLNLSFEEDSPPPTVEELSEEMTNANYGTFLTLYAWETEPEGENIFFDTSAVEFLESL